MTFLKRGTGVETKRFIRHFFCEQIELGVTPYNLKSLCIIKETVLAIALCKVYTYLVEKSNKENL